MKSSEIQELFPNPVAYRDAIQRNDPKAYDVGGAFLLYLSGAELVDESPLGMRFPVASRLACAMLRANPNLGPASALMFAASIIIYGNSRNFSDSWRTLHEALKWDKPKAWKSLKST